MTQSDGRLVLHPIGIIRSPYRDKFAVPRQSGLAPSVSARLNILPEFAIAEAFAGLEQASHVWLQWQFHKHAPGEWKPSVRPPRLGGNARLGVFATRSSFRPNSLGLSVCRLQSINLSDGVTLHLSGSDLVDGTPVFDIKPYVPYADRVEEARLDWAESAPQSLAVRWSAEAEANVDDLNLDDITLAMIAEILSLDPRPAFHKDTQADRVYGCKLADYNVRWMVKETQIEILSVNPLTD